MTRGHDGGLEPVVLHVVGEIGDAVTLSAASSAPGRELRVVFGQTVEVLGLYRGPEDVLLRRAVLPRGTVLRVTFAAPERLRGGPWRRIDSNDDAGAVRWECGCGWRTWSYAQDGQEPEACAKCMGVECPPK